jgi:hypothetical protein
LRMFTKAGRSTVAKRLNRCGAMIRPLTFASWPRFLPDQLDVGVTHQFARIERVIVQVEHKPDQSKVIDHEARDVTSADSDR